MSPSEPRESAFSPSQKPRSGALPTYLEEDLQTPALDTALQPRVLRRLQGTSLLQALHRAFQDDPYDDGTPLHENHGARVYLFWRFARTIARIAGICAEDETLDQATTNQKADPWYDPGVIVNLSPGMQQLIRKNSASSILFVFSRGPVPLLPSPKSISGTNNWFEAISVLVDNFAVYRTEIGRNGMQGLDTPKSCQFAAVTPDQILALEELLIDEAQNLIIKVGERPAIANFRDKYGLTRAESHALMRLARAEALRMDGSSIEENRAIMVAQLKDYLARTKQSCNQKDELSALKELGRVQGLTRTEPEDAAMEFFNTVARVAKRQDAKQLEQDNLRKIIDAEVVTEGGAEVVHDSNGAVVTNKADDGDDPDEDAEAIEAFDRENL